MLYPVISPFLSENSGRSQVSVKALEYTSVEEIFRGGPLGAVCMHVEDRYDIIYGIKK